MMLLTLPISTAALCSAEYNAVNACSNAVCIMQQVLVHRGFNGSFDKQKDALVITVSSMQSQWA